MTKRLAELLRIRITDGTKLESHGLLRVDLETSTVTRLEDAPGSTSVGCDGIAWDRGAIVALQTASDRRV